MTVQPVISYTRELPKEQKKVGMELTENKGSISRNGEGTREGNGKENEESSDILLNKKSTTGKDKGYLSKKAKKHTYIIKE